MLFVPVWAQRTLSHTICRQLAKRCLHLRAAGEARSVTEKTQRGLVLAFGLKMRWQPGQSDEMPRDGEGHTLFAVRLAGTVLALLIISIAGVTPGP